MNRRRLLLHTSATVAAASLGGCLGGLDGLLGNGNRTTNNTTNDTKTTTEQTPRQNTKASPTETESSSIFQSISTHGMALVVRFHDEPDIRIVNLISEGQRFNGTRLAAGESKAIIGLLALSEDETGIEYSYSPGVSMLVAVDANGTEYERTITIRPNTSLTNMAFLHERQQNTYGTFARYTAPVLTLVNSSPTAQDVLAGPDLIGDSAITGRHVPLPHPYSAGTGADLSVLGEPSDAIWLDDWVAVGANTTTQFITDHLPFAFSDTTSKKHPDIQTYASTAAVRRQWKGKTVTARLQLKNVTGIRTDFAVTFDGTVQQKVLSGLLPSFYFDGATIDGEF